MQLLPHDAARHAADRSRASTLGDPPPSTGTGFGGVMLATLAGIAFGVWIGYGIGTDHRTILTQ